MEKALKSKQPHLLLAYDFLFASASAMFTFIDSNLRMFYVFTIDRPLASVCFAEQARVKVQGRRGVDHLSEHLLHYRRF